jgi:glycosyltransferase involved in cell wall biosynthesis
LRDVVVERVTSDRGVYQIAVSKANSEDLIKKMHYPKDRTRIVYNGVDPAMFNVQRSPVRVRVVAVGRLAQQKNFSLLIKAMREVLRPIPFAHLVIAGQGELQDELQTLAERLEVPVHWAGFVDDVRPILETAEVVANSSLWESHSIAMMEAMAAGIPVVATNIAGNAEFINDGENGILVASEPESMANAILRVLGDAKFASTLGSNARHYARQFSWEHTAEMLMEVYNGACTLS